MNSKSYKNKQSNAYTNLAFCILLWASIPVATKKILVELNEKILISAVVGIIVIVVGVLSQYFNIKGA